MRSHPCNDQEELGHAALLELHAEARLDDAQKVVGESLEVALLESWGGFWSRIERRVAALQLHGAQHLRPRLEYGIAAAEAGKIHSPEKLCQRHWALGPNATRGYQEVGFSQQPTL